MPTDEEWQQLEMAVGLSAKEAKENGWRGSHGTTLKSGGNSGFNVLMGGYRSTDGSFYRVGAYAYFWSSSAYDASPAWFRSFNASVGEVSRYYYYKQLGFSVRLVRD